MTNPPSAAPGVAVEAKLEELLLSIDALVDLEVTATLKADQSDRHNPEYVAADKAAVEARNKLKDALRTALLAGAAGGEPVAQYQVKATYCDLWSNVGKPEYESILKSEGPTMVRKLYAHPPAPVRAPQEVTDSEVRSVWEFLTAKNANHVGGVREALELFLRIRQVTGALPAKEQPLKQRMSEKNHLVYVADPLSSTACRGEFVNDVLSWWWRAGLVYERQSAAEEVGLLLRSLAATQPSAAPAEPTDLEPERDFLRGLIAEVHRDQLPTNRLQNIAARAELRLRKLP